MADVDKPAVLSFEMTPEVAERLIELRDLVRAEGHARPSQKRLVEALIFGAPRDGEELERDWLVPLRKAQPEVDL